jgi:hypothetical protein
MKKIYISEGINESFPIEVKGVDLTGKSLRFMIKKNINDYDTEAIFDKIVTTHADALNGLTYFEMTKQEINAIIASYGYTSQYGQFKLYDVSGLDSIFDVFRVMFMPELIKN